MVSLSPTCACPVGPSFQALGQGVGGGEQRTNSLPFSSIPGSGQLCPPVPEKAQVVPITSDAACGRCDSDASRHRSWKAKQPHGSGLT